MSVFFLFCWNSLYSIWLTSKMLAHAFSNEYIHMFSYERISIHLFVVSILFEFNVNNIQFFLFNNFFATIWNCRHIKFFCLVFNYRTYKGLCLRCLIEKLEFKVFYLRNKNFIYWMNSKRNFINISKFANKSNLTIESIERILMK